MNGRSIPATMIYSPLTDEDRTSWAQTVQSAALALAGSQVRKAPREDIVLALSMLGVREMLAGCRPEVASAG